jgi:phosphohistidine phosphatase SixA
VQQLATRPWVTVGVALAGAGVITLTPITAPLPDVHVPDIQLTAGEEEMVLDLVRHGQSTDNASQIINTVPPGATLTPEGVEQAQNLASPDNPMHLASPDSYSGIFASELIRTQQTAADWLTAAGAPSTPVTVLPGLDEINAGIYEGQPEFSLAGILDLLAPVSWVLGSEFVSIPGSTTPNGVAFDESYSNAVQTIYNAGGATTDGHLTDAAFTSDLAMTTWTLMNVKNPDFTVLFEELLKNQDFVPNTGQIVVQGNPTDGWTLVSFDGQAVPQTPGLAPGLFVDYRDLVTAPQFAAYNIYEAILGGDPTTITSAIQNGFDEINAAITQFPQAVIDTITGALGDGAAAGGQVTGDTLTDALASMI